MDDLRDWSRLGNFSALGEAVSVSINSATRLEASLANVRIWEQSRLTEEVEWSLVVLASGEAFERRGVEYATTFEGFAPEEYLGAILSHTHVRGYPPSDVDVLLLIHLPRVLQFRVARAGRKTIVLRRQRIVGRVDAALSVRAARERAIGTVGRRPSLQAIMESFWLEMQLNFETLGVECWEEDL